MPADLRLTALLSTILVVLVTVGCSSPSSTEEGDADSVKEGGKISSKVTAFPSFPRWPSPSGELKPLGEAYGTLELHERCLRIDAEGGVSYLPIWPDHAVLERTEGSWTVRDTVGNVSITVGNPIYVGGGEALTPPNTGAGCDGPYWNVTEILSARPSGQPAPPQPPPTGT